SPAMTITRVAPGQEWAPRPASQENEIADAVNWVTAHRRGDTFDRPSRQRDYGIIALRNQSGSDIARGQVLAIAGPMITTEPASLPQHYMGRPVHDGTLPSVPTRLAVAVADEEVASGAIGRFVAQGLCVAKVNVTATWHRRAYPVASSPQL